MNLQIKALSSSRLNDYLDFFDSRAFCDNSDWAGCYCVFTYFSDDEEWMCRSGDMNHSGAIRMIEEGTLNGYIAYDGDTVVGWCNAGAKHRTRGTRTLKRPARTAAVSVPSPVLLSIWRIAAEA